MNKEYKYWFIPAKNKFIKPIDIVTNDYGDEYFKYTQNGKEKYFLKRLCKGPYKKILKQYTEKIQAWKGHFTKAE